MKESNKHKTGRRFPAVEIIVKVMMNMDGNTRIAKGVESRDVVSQL